MKVIYIKDFVGKVTGDIIETDFATANFLIAKGVCVEYAKKEITDNNEVNQPTVKKKPLTNKKTVVTDNKKAKKGRPKKK